MRFDFSPQRTPRNATTRLPNPFDCGRDSSPLVADRNVRATQKAAHGSLLLSGWETAGDDRGKFLDGDVEGFHGFWQ